MGDDAASHLLHHTLQEVTRTSKPSSGSSTGAGSLCLYGGKELRRASGRNRGLLPTAPVVQTTTRCLRSSSRSYSKSKQGAKVLPAQVPALPPLPPAPSQAGATAGSTAGLHRRHRLRRPALATRGGGDND